MLDDLFRRCHQWLAITGLTTYTLSKRLFSSGLTLDRAMAGECTIGDERIAAAHRWLDDNPPETWRERNRRGRKPKEQR